MKKLCRKGTVHPSNQLSFLPAAILTLTAALSPQDKEVLAYLISSSNNNISINPEKSTQGGATEHPSSFNCDCFRCYMSYWIRWDSSPNRQLIHEIIDACEDAACFGMQPKKASYNKKKKDRKKRPRQMDNTDQRSLEKLGEVAVDEESNRKDEQVAGGGSVRRFVSLIGERIWGTVLG